MQTIKEGASEFLAHRRVAVTGVSRHLRPTAATPCTSASGIADTTSSP